MTPLSKPVDLLRRCGPVVHAIEPGQRIGGPRVAGSLLMFFGEQLARELGLHAPAARTPTRRPRR